MVHSEPIDDEGETRIAMIGDDMKRSDIRRTKPLMGFARFFGGKESIKLDFFLLGRREAKRWARREIIRNSTDNGNTEKGSKLRA